MKNKDSHNRKQYAILALPVSMALGICVGTMFGAVSQNMPLAIGIGLAVGSVAGLIIFMILFHIKK